MTATEQTFDPLHINGRCECYGEGRCALCRRWDREISESEIMGQAFSIGRLVVEKRAQYGNSAGKSAMIMEILYPSGVPVHAYADSLLVVRIIDKLSRIAQRGADGADLGGESPYRDIAGYGLIGATKDGERGAR